MLKCCIPLRTLNIFVRQFMFPVAQKINVCKRLKVVYLRNLINLATFWYHNFVLKYKTIFFIHLWV